jgi:hypothetical protein
MWASSTRLLARRLRPRSWRMWSQQPNPSPLWPPGFLLFGGGVVCCGSVTPIPYSKSLSLSVRGDGHVAARIIEVTGTMLNSQVHCTEHQPRPALRAAGMVPRVQRHVGQRGRRLSGLTLSDGPRTWCSAYRLAKVWCRGKHNGTHLSATVGVQLVGMKGDESVCGDRWRVSTYSALAVPASDLPVS